MEPGELEIRKAFEEVTTKNVKTMIDYSTQTRELVRVLGDEVKELKNMVAARDGDITQLRQQLALVQSKLYKGGS